MDLIRIGKHIAEKRKALGLTQKQLAEKLNMSDKSVSKWERGICLPDVSVYLELCRILEMSINEFLAGEEIPDEKIIKKSEDNLLQVTEESKRRQWFLKRIIAALIVVICILVIFVLGHCVRRYLAQTENYIVALEPESVETQTAELVSGSEEAYLFKYFLYDEFDELIVYMSEYHSGELLKKTKIGDVMYDNGSVSKGGMIAVIPDFEDFKVRFVISDDMIGMYNDYPILERAEEREYYGRSATGIEDRKLIKSNEEQGLCALIYGKNGISMIPVDLIESGEAIEDNEYVYYISFCFYR